MCFLCVFRAPLEYFPLPSTENALEDEDPDLPFSAKKAILLHVHNRNPKFEKNTTKIFPSRLRKIIIKLLKLKKKIIILWMIPNFFFSKIEKFLFFWFCSFYVKHLFTWWPVFDATTWLWITQLIAHKNDNNFMDNSRLLFFFLYEHKSHTFELKAFFF